MQPASAVVTGISPRRNRIETIQRTSRRCGETSNPPGAGFPDIFLGDYPDDKQNWYSSADFADERRLTGFNRQKSAQSADQSGLFIIGTIPF
jgi:hypothetical protein